MNQFSQKHRTSRGLSVVAIGGCLLACWALAPRPRSSLAERAPPVQPGPEITGRSPSPPRQSQRIQGRSSPMRSAPTPTHERDQIEWKWSYAADSLDLDLISCAVGEVGNGRFGGDLEEWTDDGRLLGPGRVSDGWLFAALNPSQDAIRGLVSDSTGVVARVTVVRGPRLPTGAYDCRAVSIDHRITLAGTAVVPGGAAEMWVRSCSGLARTDVQGRFEVDAVSRECDVTVMWRDEAGGWWCSEPFSGEVLAPGGAGLLDVRQALPEMMCAHLSDGRRMDGWYEALEVATLDLAEGAEWP